MNEATLKDSPLGDTLAEIIRQMVREEIERAGVAPEADGVRLIVGAEAIATAIFGEATSKNVRRVYTWHDAGTLPSKKIGGSVTISKQALDEFIAALGR